MAKLQPYQYMVLKHPKDDDEQNFDSEVLIESQKPFLAKNQEMAMLKVARLLPEEHIQDLDRIEFFVRPF